MPVHGHVNQIRHNVIRQLDGLHVLAAILQVARVDQLHQQAQKLGLVDPRCLHRLRLDGNALQKILQHLLVNGANGHQVVAHTAATAGLTLQRLDNIRQSNQIRLDQQIAQSHSRTDSVLLAAPALPLHR